MDKTLYFIFTTILQVSDLMAQRVLDLNEEETIISASG